MEQTCADTDLEQTTSRAQAMDGSKIEEVPARGRTDDTGRLMHPDRADIANTLELFHRKIREMHQDMEAVLKYGEFEKPKVLLRSWYFIHQIAIGIVIWLFAFVLQKQLFSSYGTGETDGDYDLLEAGLSDCPHDGRSC